MGRGLAVCTKDSVMKSKERDPEPFRMRFKALCKVRICLKSGSGCCFESHWCETNAALPKSSLKTTSSPLAFKTARSPKIQKHCNPAPCLTSEILHKTLNPKTRIRALYPKALSRPSRPQPPEVLRPIAEIQGHAPLPREPNTP